MILADISIKRPVLMTMVIMAFAVVGLFSLMELGIDLIPKIEFPFVTVQTIYPGAGPEEIETLISKPIEEEVGSINGVKNITSISQEGISFVFIEFQMEVEVDIAAIDVKEKVDAIRYELPDDAEAPSISKFDINAMPILDLAVNSPRPLEEVYKICEDEIKPELAKINGLANIDLVGGKEREIRIEADKSALAARGLSLINLVSIIAGENLNVPSGHISEGRKEYSIRMEAEFSDLEEIRNLKLLVPEEEPIHLTDVARVYDDFEEQRELARFNGESSVGLSLVKRSDANTVEVAHQTKKAIERLQSYLPADIKVSTARDRSEFIEESVHDVTSNMIIGILLTAIVLLLFLHSWRGTVIAAVSMPVSIVATFTLLRFADFTLNMMTLMGLAISIGILVANSIVVLENIERYRATGMPANKAASKGTGEIAIAVAASTLTNVVVFTPIAFMSGITGQFFRQFGLTVAFATVFSLIVSYTLTPMMASIKMKKTVYAVFGIVMALLVYRYMGILTTVAMVVIFGIFAFTEFTGIKKKLVSRWDAGFDSIKESYQNTLEWAVTHRKTVVFTIVGLFIGSALLMQFVGSEFFPSSDERQFSISVEMPSGANMGQTDQVLQKIEAVLEEEDIVKTVYTALGKSEASSFMGGGGVQLGVILVQLVDEEQDGMSTNKFIDYLRPKLADIPDAKLVLAMTEAMGGGASGLQIEVTGPDMDKLVELSNEVMAITAGTPGAVDVASSWKLGKPELNILPHRTQLSDAGITAGQVAMSLRRMIEGEVASKYREGGDEYDIRVKLSQRDRESLQNVAEYIILTPNGNVPLARVADLDFTEGPSNILRKNKQRMVTISSNISGTTLGELQGAIEKRLTTIEVPPGYKVHFGGESEIMAESFTELLRALLMAIVLTYMLMAAILESYKNPFIIILTLPLGFIGVAISLVLTGNTFSMLTMMAMVMLVGIVVNNGILLIDYIGALRREGKGLKEAILEACPIRLRPILMTNIATALAMAPLALGIGAGGEFRAPMAVVSIGGLISSTIFTLYLIPTIYASFEGMRKLEKAERKKG